MGDDLQRQALARDLARRQQLASHDELRVIDRVLGRLELGRERYGRLDLAKPRPWRREFGEEILDAVIYDTIETIVDEDRAHAELQIAASEEIAAWQADQRTRVSGEPARIALSDISDREPYDEWELREFGEGE